MLSVILMMRYDRKHSGHILYGGMYWMLQVHLL